MINVNRYKKGLNLIYYINRTGFSPMNDKKCAEECVSYIKNNLHISRETDLIIDFTADQGLFISGAQSLVNAVLFYDKAAEPLHPAIASFDFLTPAFNFDKFNKTYLAGLWFDDIHVQGCPPAEDAQQCIEVAVTFAQSISFLLPIKGHYTFPSNFHCLFRMDMPKKNKVFQIWLKADY